MKNNNLYKKNFLGVVVLFWNDYKKTIKCLNSIINQSKISPLIVLIDNNSDQIYFKNIKMWLKKKNIAILRNKKEFLKVKDYSNQKKIYYIKNKENYGCGLGHNVGYKFLLKNKFKYIARMDNDIVVPKTTLNNLIQRLENNKEIVGISPKILHGYKKKYVWYRGTTIGYNLKFQKNCADYNGIHLDRKDFKGLIKSDAVCGCASLMKSSALKKAGLSDPDFFYGEEDIDLSYRLRQHEGLLCVDLDEKVFHFVSVTVGRNWAKNIYYNYKYRLLLIKKIGNLSDKFFGYSVSILKFLFSFFFIFNRYYSSRILIRFLAIKHFIQSKYGEFDRKNYSQIDNYFKNFSKNTTLGDILKFIFFEKNKL